MHHTRSCIAYSEIYFSVLCRFKRSSTMAMRLFSDPTYHVPPDVTSTAEDFLSRPSRAIADEGIVPSFHGYSKVSRLCVLAIQNHGPAVPTATHMHTTHTHTHTHTHTLSLSLSHTHTHTHTKCTLHNTHARTHAHTHVRTHSHTQFK